MTNERNNKNNVTINHVTKEIVISKQFNTRAKRYNTPEYKELLNVIKDFPSYEVKVRTTNSRVNRKADSYKGLTYSYMETYVRSHDKDGLKYKEFIALLPSRAKGFNKEDSVILKDQSYGVVKKWFLSTFNFEEKTKKEVA